MRGDLYKLNNEVSINSLRHCYLAAFKSEAVRVVKTKVTGIIWKS